MIDRFFTAMLFSLLFFFFQFSRHVGDDHVDQPPNHPPQPKRNRIYPQSYQIKIKKSKKGGNYPQGRRAPSRRRGAHATKRVARTVSPSTGKHIKRILHSHLGPVFPRDCLLLGNSLWRARGAQPIIRRRNVWPRIAEFTGGPTVSSARHVVPSHEKDKATWANQKSASDPPATWTPRFQTFEKKKYLAPETRQARSPPQNHLHLQEPYTWHSIEPFASYEPARLFTAQHLTIRLGN